MIQGLVLFIVLGSTAVAWSQEQGMAPEEVLTVEHAVALALTHNRQVTNAALEVEKAGDNIAAARTRRWPSLNFSIRGTHNLTSESYTIKAGQLGAFPATGPIPATDVKLKSASGVSGFLSTEVALPLSQQYRIGLGIQQLELGQDLSGQELRARRQQTGYEVKQAYYRVLQAQSALAATQETLTFLRELEQVVERYVREQTALASDSLDVKTRLARAEHEALAQRNALASQKEQLNHLLGRDLRMPFRVSETPPLSPTEVDTSTARARALAQRPEARIAHLKIQNAESDVRIKRAEYLPDVSAVVSYARPLNTSFIPSQIASAGIQLQWEFFDWGRKQRELAERGRTLTQARNEEREARGRVELDVNTRMRTLTEARSLLRVEKLGQDTAREKLRVTMDRYRQQAALVSDTLQAQSALADATHRYQHALLAIWTARADLDRALGEE
jgi:outer membrane protein